MKKPILKKLYSASEWLLPKNRAGDAAFTALNFLVRHGRLPSRKPLLNDVMARMKMTGEIASPLRTYVSDKKNLKAFVAERAGERYNVPTIAVLATPEQVDAFEFPASCCIKPTHGSGDVILRRNGEPVDRETIKSWWSTSHYRRGREANYKGLPPRVVVEPIIFEGAPLWDIRIFCYRGRPGVILVDIGPKGEVRRALLDTHWNQLPFRLHYPLPESILQRPSNLEEMLEVARKLSAPFELIRVDFYSDGHTLYVGELTNCHGNAIQYFYPPEGEQIVSAMIFESDTSQIGVSTDETGE